MAAVAPLFAFLTACKRAMAIRPATGSLHSWGRSYLPLLEFVLRSVPCSFHVPFVTYSTRIHLWVGFIELSKNVMHKIVKSTQLDATLFYKQTPPGFRSVAMFPLVA